MQAKLVMHHDDPPCEERLDANGDCQKCKVHPDTQSVSYYCYCPNCDVKLKNMICPVCKKRCD